MRNIAKMHPSLLLPCNHDVEGRHKQLWRRLGMNGSVQWLRFLSTVTGRPDYRYIPSPVYYGVVERCLNDCNRASFEIEDKNLMSLYVPKELRAYCVLRYMRGCFYDDEFNPLSFAMAERVLADYGGDVVGKIAQGSSGGHSVELFRDEKGRKIGKKHELTIRWIVENVTSYVVQERVYQEPIVASLNSASVNTCRVVTYRLPQRGQACVGSTMLRVGAGDDIVDNISSGGVSVGVREDGSLNANGLDCQYGVVSSTRTGMAFSGVRLPGFADVRSAAVSIASKVPGYNILGFDFVVRSDGRPCVIEINATSLCCIEAQQSGPMFGEDTEDVVDWCLEHRSFDQFDHIRTWY